MIRLGVSKTRGISPARKSRSDTGFALLSILERNRARSALLTVFSITQPDQCWWFFQPIYFPEKKMLPLLALDNSLWRKQNKPRCDEGSFIGKE